MTVSLYPCLGCGRLTESPDKYVVCDRCLFQLEQQLTDEPRSGGAATPAGQPSSTAGLPLSPDELDERARRLLDDW